MNETWTVQQVGTDFLSVHRGTPCTINPEQEDDGRQLLVDSISRHASAGLAGAMQLAEDGTIHAMGDFIVHPKGFHHNCKGAPGDASRFPQEVDAFSSGMVVVRKSRFEAIRGHDLLTGSLGLIQLCLELATHAPGPT